MSNPTGMANASLWTQGAGTALAAMGTFTNAREEKKAAKANAAQAEEQAKDAARRGERDAQKIQMRAAQIKGSQRAGMAARGLDLSEGSPLAILQETDYFSDLDAKTTEENTKNEIAGFRTMGRNYARQAKAINPWLSAGASALAGAGQVADRWYQYRTTGAKS